MSAGTQELQPILWMERVTDWFNPILVKETRQALKSRGFLMTFMLMLIACWIVSFYYTMLQGALLEYGNGGRQLFYWYYMILCFAVLVAVPFGAYRSLLSEREETTFDLLSITTLKPGQIVWGKLASAVLQTVIYYAAIAPFIAFTSLLQGVDLLQGGVLLGLVLYASILLSMACLTAGAVAQQKVWHFFTMLALLFGLFWIAFVFAIGIPETLQFTDLRGADFWYVLLFTLIMGLSYFFLLQQISTSILTFDSDNRSSGIRIVCSIQFLLWWLGMTLLTVHFNAGTGWSFQTPLIVAVAMSMVHWLAVGLFAVTERPELSPRLISRLPRNQAVRLLCIPWMPGGSRGLLYIIVHTLLLAGITSLVVELFMAGNDFPWGYLWGCCGYLVFILGFVSWIGRKLLGLSHDLRPAHSRVLGVIIMALFMIVPYLIVWTTHAPYSLGRYSLLFVTVLHETLLLLSRKGPESQSALNIVLSLAAVALIVNVPAMTRGIREILQPPNTGVDHR